MLNKEQQILCITSIFPVLFCFTPAKQAEGSDLDGVSVRCCAYVIFMLLGRHRCLIDVRS